MLLKQITLAIATTALLGAGACVGDFSGSQVDPIEPGPGAPGEEDAVNGNEKELFVATVQPILTTNCAGAGCHSDISPVFIQGGVATYEAVAASSIMTGGWDSSAAAVLTKIDGGHSGVVYAEAERQAIVTWIDAEAALGKDVGGAVVATDQQALMEFAGCMTLGNWNTVQFYDWAEYDTGEGQCQSCHSGGLSGFNTRLRNAQNEEDPACMLAKNRMFAPNRFVMGFFTVAYDELTGEPMVVPAHNKIQVMADGGGDGVGHPDFDYGPQNDYYLKLENFYNLTMLEMQNNPACKDAGFATAEEAYLECQN